MAEKVNLSKTELEQWTSFWVETGFIMFSNKNRIRVVNGGKTVLLCDWVFLNMEWLADIYYLLWSFSKDSINEQKAKLVKQKKEQAESLDRLRKIEDLRKKVGEIVPKSKEEEERRVQDLVKKKKRKNLKKNAFRNGGSLGVVKCNEIASVWGAKNIETPEVKEVVLMTFEEIELIHFVYPKRQKMLILEGDLTTKGGGSEGGVPEGVKAEGTAGESSGGEGGTGQVTVNERGEELPTARSRGE